MLLAAEPDDLRFPLGHQKSPPSIVRVSCAIWSSVNPRYSITPFITNLPAMNPAASPSASAMSFDLGNIAEPQTNTPGLGVLTGHLWMLPLLTPPSGDMGILRAVAIPMLSLFAGIAANARVP